MAKSTLVPQEALDRANELRGSGVKSWAKIGRIVGVKTAILRRRIDPAFRERLRNYSRRYMTEFREQYHAVDRNATTVITHTRPPLELLEERDRMMALELTPNQLILGDPLPGRSYLDKKRGIRV